MSFEEAAPHPPAPRQPRLPGAAAAGSIRNLLRVCRTVPAQRNTRATGSETHRSTGWAISTSDEFYLVVPVPALSTGCACTRRVASLAATWKKTHDLLVEKKELQLQIESKLYVYINLLFLNQGCDSREGPGLAGMKADPFLSCLSSWVHPPGKHATGGWHVSRSYLLQPAVEQMAVISASLGQLRKGAVPSFSIIGFTPGAKGLRAERRCMK